MRASFQTDMCRRRPKVNGLTLGVWEKWGSSFIAGALPGRRTGLWIADACQRASEEDSGRGSRFRKLNPGFGQRGAVKLRLIQKNYGASACVGGTSANVEATSVDVEDKSETSKGFRRTAGV